MINHCIKLLLIILIIFSNFVDINAKWQITDSLNLSDATFGNSCEFLAVKTYNNKDILVLANVGFFEPQILKSIDSGKTFKRVFKFGKGAEKAYELIYPSEKLAMVVCDSGYYLRSTDNGENWEIRRFDNRKRTWRISAFDDKRIIVFQSNDTNTTYLISNDYGLSWVTMNTNKPVKVRGFSFVFAFDGGTTYFIEADLNVDSVYYFHKSTDYGETWEYYPGPKNPPYGDFYFYNKNLGFNFGGDRISIS